MFCPVRKLADTLKKIKETKTLQKFMRNKERFYN